MLTVSTTPLGCGEARRDRPLSAVFSLGVFGRPLALGLVLSAATLSMAPSSCAPGVAGHRAGPQASRAADVVS